MTKTSSSAAGIADLQHAAQAAMRDGRYAEALAACRRILARQPGRADVHAVAGMAALRAGDAAAAVDHLERADALRPDNAETLFELGNALRQAGRHDESVAAYRRAVEGAPRAAPIWHNLGNALLATGAAADAADAYRRVLALDDRNPDTHRNLGLALQKQGDLAAAIGAYRAALARRPGWPPASSNLVQALFETGDAAAAVAACDDWLVHHPGHVEGLALKCAALNETGERAALDALLDFDRFVTVQDIDSPAGYGSLEAFNAALADFVLGHPTLKLPPEDDPTYHHPRLQITDEILGVRDGPMAAMEAIMVRAVEEYWAHLGDDPGHPFLAARPRKWTLSAWAVVLRGEGNLVPHIHLDGYLGGSYYVVVPAEVADPVRQEGWFELGRPPEELALNAAPVVRALQPAPGRLLQFPGYFYHRTTPYRSPTGEIRITIAFDVVPS